MSKSEKQCILAQLSPDSALVVLANDYLADCDGPVYIGAFARMYMHVRRNQPPDCVTALVEKVREMRDFFFCIVAGYD